MPSFARISKGRLASVLTAGAVLALAGCGPDYAIFKVHVASAKTPRNDIAECYMTVKDQAGATVLDHLKLEKVFGSNGSDITIRWGCEGGLTNADIGYFSFSTSRSSGTLTFQVDATDDGNKVVQTGSASGDVKPFPPEVGVEVVIQ